MADGENLATGVSAKEAPAHCTHVQRLQKLTDLGPFVEQLEALMGTSIRVPADAVPRSARDADDRTKPRNVFSVRGIWASEAERRSALSGLYNFGTLRKRGWLRDLLLEESDSDSNGEHQLNEEDLRTLLKIHRCRRKYQKEYHNDIMNSQYTYYGAGLLSEKDRYPDNQRYVQDQYGFQYPLPPPPQLHIDAEASRSGPGSGASSSAFQFSPTFPSAPASLQPTPPPIACPPPDAKALLSPPPHPS